MTVRLGGIGVIALEAIQGLPRDYRTQRHLYHVVFAMHRSTYGQHGAYPTDIDPTQREIYSLREARYEAQVRAAACIRSQRSLERTSAGARRAMLWFPMNVEAVIRTVVRELVVKRDFRLPLHIATLAANGASLVTRIEAPLPGAEALSVVQVHVAGEVGDEGFAAPLHLLVTDATGRVRVAVARGHGSPSILVPSPEGEGGAT